MNRTLRALSLCALLSAQTACATITRGNHTAFEVNTTPVGAKVKTSNGFYCDSTPCSVTMPRKSEFTATITKPGYKSLDVHVTTKVSGGGGAGMAGNVLVGGLIGAGVDVATGAMLDLTPNPLTVVLEKDDPVIAATPDKASAPKQTTTQPSPTGSATPLPAPAPSDGEW